MKLRLIGWGERIRASLFLVPFAGVLTAIVLAWSAVAIDDHLDAGTADLPLGLASTVESARALLGTVAGATITFAGIAFSVSLLILQQAANQYSPRVVHTLFRDPFNKRVMALVVGTFTYCLLVLRSVRSALEAGGDPVVPNISVALAVVLGIVTILAIVASIDHSAHTMDISSILHDVEHRATSQIRREWSTSTPSTSSTDRSSAPWASGRVVRFTTGGWIQHIDLEIFVRLLPPGQTVWVEAYPGRYAIPDAPICVLSSVPDEVEAVERAARHAVTVGETRTMQQDISFGIRQLTDVSLKALSPGVNDPTTAQDAIFHTAAVLTEVLRRSPPPVPADGATVVLLQQPTHAELVDLAYDEVRRAAAGLPTVCLYLLESLHLLTSTLPSSASDCDEALRRQARLVLAGCEAADNLPTDVLAVREAYERRFGASDS